MLWGEIGFVTSVEKGRIFHEDLEGGLARVKVALQFSVALDETHFKHENLVDSQFELNLAWAGTHKPLRPECTRYL